MDHFTTDYAYKPLRKLDKRTREAKLAQTLRAALENHIGGSPSIAQKLLIDQIVSLKICIETTSKADPDWLGFCSALDRCLAQLGQAAPTGLAA